MQHPRSPPASVAGFVVRENSRMLSHVASNERSGRAFWGGGGVLRSVCLRFPLSPLPSCSMLPCRSSRTTFRRPSTPPTSYLGAKSSRWRGRRYLASWTRARRIRFTWSPTSRTLCYWRRTRPIH
ncbi:unnamed protein product [Ascophyllum nodosum]